MTTNVVTLPYRPPELLLLCGKVDHKVDVWSVGCIMFEMLTGRKLAYCVRDHSKPHHPKPLFLNDRQSFLNLYIRHLCGRPNVDAWENSASPNMLEYLKANWGRKAQGTSMKELVPGASDQAREVLEAIEDPKVVSMSELLQKPTSPEAVEVLEAMLKFEPAARKTPEELLEYKWFTDDKNCKAEIDTCTSETGPGPMAIAAVEKMTTIEELVEQVQKRVTLEPTHRVNIDL